MFIKKTISNKNDVKNGSIFQLLLFKPWEYAKKSQKFIHYYIVVDQIEIYFQDDSCGDYYLLIPTTTKCLEGNKSLLKIDYYDWFGNKDVYLKLDEIFIIEKHDFGIWIDSMTGKVSKHLPRLTIKKEPSNWRLTNSCIWSKIQMNLYNNLKNNNTMFFIIDRKSFQINNNYWVKKLNSNYVYNTIGFIPEWNENFQKYICEIVKKIDDIRIKGINSNKKEHLIKYMENHFDIKSDKEKIAKYKKYFNMQ